MMKKTVIPNHKGKRVMKMDVDGTMGIHLQEEIIMEILSRLPVQSLLRFKCVSKCWMTLISDPYFTMKHLNHARNNLNSQKFLVSQWYPHKNEFSLYRSSLSSVQQVEEVQKLDCPSNGKPWRCTLYCCYDSLALIGVFNYPDKNLLLLLWNPSTRESIVLPRTEFPPECYCTWGLGYDSASDDYKIFKVDQESRSEILALKSGSWRITNKHPTGICPDLICTDSLVFVHGAFHWIGDLSRFSVTSFSISGEVYGEIPLPEQMLSIYIHTRGCLVSVLGEMLCVYSRYVSHTKDISFKFWVMKDYDVKESWTELFNIQGTGLFSVIPKYRFSDGEVLLRCERLNHRSVFRTSNGPLGLCPQSDAIQTGFVYIESLFFPKLVS